MGWPITLPDTNILFITDLTVKYTKFELTGKFPCWFLAVVGGSELLCVHTV